MTAATLYEKLSSSKVKSKTSIIFYSSKFNRTFVPTLEEWITSFSITRSCRELFDTSSSSSEIASAHGVRFIIVFFVVLTHKSLYLNYNHFVNNEYLIEMANTNISFMFRAGPIFTDIFLMLSGMLLCYSVVGKLQKGQQINCLREIIGRYMRMMPLFAFVIIFTAWTLPYLGRGPQWSLNFNEAEICKSNSWRNFLMIHNWFGSNNMCLIHSHSVATDFTLYAVSIFLVIGLYKHSANVGIIIFGLGLVSTVMRFRVNNYKEFALYLHNGVE